MIVVDNMLIAFLNIYQKYISPHKGYCCAYSYYTGKDSCSEFSKKCVQKYGSFKAIPLTIKHLRMCTEVYKTNKDEGKEHKKHKVSKYCGYCEFPCSCIGGLSNL